MARENNKDSAKERKTEWQLYIEKIKHSPLLSAEEEKELAAKIKAGDQQAKQRLVSCNLWLVRNIAYKYQRSAWHVTGISYEDLVQEGNIGLLIAAEKFDGELGTPFAAFARGVIKQRISQALKQKGRSIRLPDKIINDIAKYGYTVDELCTKLSRQPTEQEVAKAMGITIKKMAKLRKLDNYSNDNYIIKDNKSKTTTTLFYSVADPNAVDPEKEVVDNMTYDNLTEQMDTVLNKKARFVLNERTGRNDEQEAKKLKEIGRELGLTHERVRQIQKESITKLRNFNDDLQRDYELNRQIFGLFNER
jgi:RNA polymerase primary sigma factor